eukprot:8999286-Pyramimonas_sp.AAC.1
MRFACLAVPIHEPLLPEVKSAIVEQRPWGFLLDVLERRLFPIQYLHVAGREGCGIGLQVNWRVPGARRTKLATYETGQTFRRLVVVPEREQ